MTNNEIRALVEKIEKGSMKELGEAIQEFERAGYVENEGVGNKDMTPEQTVRWYVGQGINIASSGALFAMNSWLNCLDKFVPADPITE